jgi:hypothetical protein
MYILRCIDFQNVYILNKHSNIEDEIVKSESPRSYKDELLLALTRP